MKTVVKLLCCLALVGIVGTASAEEKKANTPKKKQPPAASKTVTQPDTRVITGSYIPTSAKVRGQIAVTTSPVVVIDSEWIKRSGAADLAELLRRGGWTR